MTSFYIWVRMPFSQPTRSHDLRVGMNEPQDFSVPTLGAPITSVRPTITRSPKHALMQPRVCNRKQPFATFYLCKAEQFRQLGLVESHHRLIVDQGNGSNHQAASLQFLQRRSVPADVAIFEWYSLLRKKLFRRIAEHSAVLAENYHLLSHTVLLTGI